MNQLKCKFCNYKTFSFILIFFQLSNTMKPKIRLQNCYVTQAMSFGAFCTKNRRSLNSWVFFVCLQKKIWCLSLRTRLRTRMASPITNNRRACDMWLILKKIPTFYYSRLIYIKDILAKRLEVRNLPLFKVKINIWKFKVYNEKYFSANANKNLKKHLISFPYVVRTFHSHISLPNVFPSPLHF